MEAVERYTIKMFIIILGTKFPPKSRNKDSVSLLPLIFYNCAANGVVTMETVSRENA